MKKNLLKLLRNAKGTIPRDEIKRRIVMICLSAAYCIIMIGIIGKQTYFFPLNEGHDTNAYYNIPVFKDTQISQNFSLKDKNNSDAIQFNFKIERDPQEAVIFETKIADSNNQILNEKTISVDDYPAGIVQIDIPQNNLNINKTYTLNITGLQIPNNATLTLQSEPFQTDLVPFAKSINPTFTENKSLAILYSKPAYADGLILFTLCIFAASVICIVLWRQDIAFNTLIAILVFGTLSCFLTPILDVPDTNVHFLKSLMLSGGDFKGALPEGHNVSNSYNQICDNIQNTSLKTKLWDMAFSNDKTNINNPIADSLSSSIYLPMALGIAFARILNMSVAGIYYIGRLFSLLFYAACSYLSIKIAPKYKLFIGIAALMPMSLYLAASYNPDGVIFGIILLAIGYFLKLLYDPNPINYKQIILFGLIVSAAATRKYNYFPIVFLVFMIPSIKFKSCSQKILKCACACAIPITLILVITYFNNVGSPDPRSATWGANSTEQIKFILSNPWTVLIVICRFMYETAGHFLQTSFTFGWLSYNPPGTIPILYFMFFAAIAFCYSRYTEEDILISHPLNILKIFSSFIIIVGIFFLTTLFLYITWTKVGSLSVEGVQGRYLIPMLYILPFLAPDVWPKVCRKNLMAIQYNSFFIAILFIAACMFSTIKTYYLFMY